MYRYRTVWIKKTTFPGRQGKSERGRSQLLGEGRGIADLLFNLTN